MEPAGVTTPVSYPLFEELKRYVGFGPEDARLLREVHPALRPRLPGIVDDFYRHVLAHEGTRRILVEPAQVERLRQTLLAWMEELLLGPHDAAYHQKRTRIGLVHVRIGLSQAYVFGAMNHVRRHLVEGVRASLAQDPAKADRTAEALEKVLDLDLALLSGSYHEAEKYRDLVEFAPEMIHALDREGRFVSVNRTEEQRLGYAKEELLRLRLEDLALPEDRPVLRAHLDAVFRDGESRCEVRLLTRQGEPLEVEILALGERDPFTGDVVRTRAYVRDVTERNRMARKLTEQASLARLGEMAAVVAHEVKNPLAGIGGAVQVIGSHLPAGSSDRAIVKEILERIDALNGTVKDLLLYARPRLPKPVPLRLRAVLEDTAGLLSKDPETYGTLVTIEGEDLTVSADPELLKPVFLNLFLNAAQAMEGKGRIGVELSREGGAARVRIRDGGPGIPPEIRDRVFEPFFSTKHRGTGLGLPIAKRVVEAHGGEIRAECPPGGGTIVSLRLPLQGR